MPKQNVSAAEITLVSCEEKVTIKESIAQSVTQTDGLPWRKAEDLRELAVLQMVYCMSIQPFGLPGQH